MLGLRAGVVAGLDSVLLVAGATAFVGALIAWPLLGEQRSTTNLTAAAVAALTQIVPFTNGRRALA